MSRGWGYRQGKTSVIIVCWNRLELTQRCVESILDSGDWPDEIVFVDNASTDSTPKWVHDPPITIPVQTVTMSANVGWGRGANAGSQLAEGEFLLHLNNDTEVVDDWLTTLHAAMEPGIAAVAGRLINPDGTLQHAGTELVRDNGIFGARNIAEEQPARDVDCLSLAAALVRAVAWNQIGGVDPAFYCGYEDVDFCLRVRQQGWRLRYTPDSTVMHIGSASGPERWAHTPDNIRLLHERWSSLV